MGANEDASEQGGGDGGGTGRRPPRDLIDFYRRWSEFRGVAVALSQRAALSPAERETVSWLILLVDRIGDHDIS